MNQYQIEIALDTIMILLGFAVVITLAIIKYFQYRIKYRDIFKLPGPKPLPIIGNVLEFGNNTQEIYKNMFRLARQYGPRFVYWVGVQPALCITHEKDIEFFLSSTEHTKKSFVYSILQMWLGNGLICSSGDHWRRHRKIITPAFHFKILEQFVTNFDSCGNNLVQKIKTNCGEPIDIYPYMQLEALDTICESAMGIKINALNQPDLQYVKSVADFMSCTLKRNFSLIQHYELYAQFTSLYQTQKHNAKILKQFVIDTIKQRKLERAGPTSTNVEEDSFGIKRKIAFLDLLLSIAESNGLTDEDVREETDNFMFAGHDTTSSAITFSLFEIAKHPDVQERILEELKCVGVYKSELSYAKLQELKYTEMVIKETMRLYPIIPYVERVIENEFVYDGIKIPAGTNITMHLHSLHYKEENFPNPEEFDPERFSPEIASNRHPYSYVPFAAGPRNCIGQRYAMLSMKAVLAKVVSNFELSALPDYQLLVGNHGILKPENPVLINFKQRN